MTDLVKDTDLTLEQLIAFGILLPGQSALTFNSVVYTLETGATITIASPAGANYVSDRQR